VGSEFFATVAPYILDSDVASKGFEAFQIASFVSQV
jgi:hypothetical protein